MALTSQSRRWCFTSYTDKLEINTKGVKYYIFQGEECPQTKKRHWQGYIVLERGQRMSYVKKALNDEKAHLEVAKGTDEQCIAYCSKKESQICAPVEWGTKPLAKTRQGKRNDLEEVTAKLAEYKPGSVISWETIALQYPTVMARYEKFISKLASVRGLRLALMSPDGDISLRRTEMTPISIIYGKTGSGKTTHVKSIKDSYWKNQDNKWWDGYDGQENVIINEWTCPDSMNMLSLLRLSDHAPLKLEIKGGMIDFISKHIYITTNIEMKTILGWLDKLGEHGKALRRRITFYEMKDYKCEIVEEKSDARGLDQV